MDSVESKLLLC